jgi:hypothetical protein
VNPQNPQLPDFVGLFVFLAGFVFPDEAAAVFGPYMAIVAASTLGASFATIRRVKTTRGAALLFFLRATGFALVVSVPLANQLSAYYPSLTVRASLALVAFLVGLVGDDWPALIRWIAYAVSQRAMRALGLTSKDDKP